MTRLRNLLIAFAVAVAGGLTIRQAVRQTITIDGFTCDDWEELYNRLRTSVRGKALAVLLNPECPQIPLPTTECSQIDADTICHRGHLHGPGLTSNKPPGTSKADENTCDPTTQGTPIECVRGEDRLLARLQSSSQARRRFFRKLVSRLRHWKQVEDRGE